MSKSLGDLGAVVVLGAGVMGHGIGAHFARFSGRVCLYEPALGAAEAGKKRAEEERKADEAGRAQSPDEQARQRARERMDARAAEEKAEKDEQDRLFEIERKGGAMPDGLNCRAWGVAPQPCPNRGSYLRQVRTYHPDNNPDCTKIANDKFQKMTNKAGCIDFAGDRSNG